MSAPAGEQALRLPDFFPRVPKQCKKQAQPFFDCFSEKGEQPPEGDKEAGRTALKECASLLGPYEKCMTKRLRKKPENLIRVQEEYRIKGEST